MNKRQQKKQQLKALTNVAINASIEAVEEGKLNKPLTRKQAESFARRYIAARKKAVLAVIALRKAARISIAKMIEEWRKRISEEQNDR